MNQKYNLTDDNRWIAFGGSYPGSLAAWLREKYAHLVHGSISTSGPLLAKVDFREYFEVVVDSLATYKKDDCVTPVRKAIQQIGILMKHMVGQRTLNEKYQVKKIPQKKIEISVLVRVTINSIFPILALRPARKIDLKPSRHRKSLRRNRWWLCWRCSVQQRQSRW